MGCITIKESSGRYIVQRLRKRGKVYKKSHGWGISLTIAKERTITNLYHDVNSGKLDDRKKKMLFETFVEKYVSTFRRNTRSHGKGILQVPMHYYFSIQG